MFTKRSRDCGAAASSALLEHLGHHLKQEFGAMASLARLILDRALSRLTLTSQHERRLGHDLMLSGLGMVCLKNLIVVVVHRGPLRGR